MATTLPLPLPLLLILLFFSISASARPCKGIFFFSSTSYYTIPSQNSNSNSNSNPTYVTFYLTSTRTPTHNRFFLIPKPFSTRLVFDHDQEQHEHRPMMFKPEVNEEVTNSFPDLPSRVHTKVESIFNDRTKDIMSVVGALLFGMGCGALTAATMYLVWSFFMPNRFEFEDSDDDDEIEDLYNPKKPGQGGYMVIPSKVVDDMELKKAVDETVVKQEA